MLFTKECDYAVRILRALSSEKIRSIQEICKEEHISSAMAYKIARKLEKSKIIKSYRGSTGGYALNCDLDSLTLFDVFNAMDSHLVLMECLRPDHKCLLNKDGTSCKVHSELCQIQRNLNQQLKEKSLAKIFNS